ncbi:hypothetical protein GCM10011350_09830 [Marinomonas arctica]|nr:hypothetical protein GCM10011350_09830 [Marinomonas arctica]
MAKLEIAMLVSIECSKEKYIYMVIYTVLGCFLTSPVRKFNSHKINAALTVESEKAVPI